MFTIINKYSKIQAHNKLNNYKSEGEFLKWQD